MVYTYLINKLVRLCCSDDHNEHVNGSHCPAEGSQVAKSEREDNICGVGVEEEPGHRATACLGWTDAPAEGPQITDDLKRHEGPEDEGYGRPELRGNRVLRPTETENADEEDCDQRGAQNGHVTNGG